MPEKTSITVQVEIDNPEAVQDRVRELFRQRGWPLPNGISNRMAVAELLLHDPECDPSGHGFHVVTWD